MIIDTNSNGELYVRLEGNPLTNRLDELIEFYGGPEALALAIEREWYGYDHKSERDAGPPTNNIITDEIKERSKFYYRPKRPVVYMQVKKRHIQKRGRQGDY